MQHITTRYCGPTNTKGPRIQAKSNTKTRYFHRDCAESVDDAHKHAAESLANELWAGKQDKPREMLGYETDADSWTWFFAEDPWRQTLTIAGSNGKNGGKR